MKLRSFVLGFCSVSLFAFAAHAGTIEAMTMADKIVVLNAGRIEQVGSEVRDRATSLMR